MGMIKDLQARQLAWVTHNFPAQVAGPVTKAEVKDVMLDAQDFGSAAMHPADKIANAINAGDPRLVRRPYHGLLGMVEEIGELSHAFLKAEQGIRKGVNIDKQMGDIKDALADTVIFLLSFCNTHNIDFEEVLTSTWDEVEKRDWIRFPGDGLTK